MYHLSVVSRFIAIISSIFVVTHLFLVDYLYVL